jgi:hypothetical protein
VGAKTAFIGLDQAHLAHGGGGLEFVQGLGALLPTQALDALGNGAAADQDDFPAQFREGRNLGRPQGQAGVVQTPALVGDQAAAHLHDQATGAGDDRGIHAASSSASGASGSSLVASARVLPQVLHDGEHQGLAAFPGDRGDGEHGARWRDLPAVIADEVGDAAGPFFLGHQVGLVQHQPAGLAIEGFVVLAQFLDDGARLVHRVGFRIEGGKVHDMEQQPCAGQVAQELVAQAGALGGALDQAGNVGHHEAAVLVHAHHAQVGVQGGEGIVGHLGLGGGYRTDEGGLAGVGHAQEAHVRQHLQLHAQAPLLAGLAGGGLARRPVGAGLEMQVAQATLAALGDQGLLAIGGQIGQFLAGFFVPDHGAHRHPQDQVVGALAVAVAAASLLPVPGLERAGVAVLHQGVDVAVGQRPDAAALAAVAAVRAAHGDEFLPAEGHGAVATAAGGDVDQDFIDEFHGWGCCPLG